MSWLKTFSLLIVLTALLVAVGAILFGAAGAIVFFVIAAMMNIFSFWFSGNIALRMAHAKEVTEQDEPRLHFSVSEVARMANMPTPRVFLIDNDSPNAFATGRNPKNAALAVTTGIRRLLNRDELGAVIGHELAHVGNRDTLIMTTVATIAMAIGMLAFVARFAMFFGGFGGRGRGGGGGYGAIIGIVGILVVAIVLPIVATLVRLAISRSREYQADATGAKTSGNPLALASALEKLEMGSQRRPMKVNEAVAHLYIVNPLTGKKEDDHRHTDMAVSGGGFSKLFSTHPPIPERVKRLRDMRMGW